MATIRYDDVPYVVTLTNNVALEKVYDAGSLQRAKKIFTEADGTKYTYNNPDRTFQFYKTNSFVTVGATLSNEGTSTAAYTGDAVKVTAETSEEAEYFKTFDGNGFSVTLKGHSEN